MMFRKRIIADGDRFSSQWARVVLHFFQLFVGNPALAETLTIETLAQHLRASRTACDETSAIPLLRRALAIGVRAVSPGCTAPDPIALAINGLEPSQRAVVVLFRGLGLDLRTVAEITGFDASQVRRICMDALDELHRSLSCLFKERSK